jgi:hypothetical protein
MNIIVASKWFLSIGLIDMNIQACSVTAISNRCGIAVAYFVDYAVIIKNAQELFNGRVSLKDRLDHHFQTADPPSTLVPSVLYLFS